MCRLYILLLAAALVTLPAQCRPKQGGYCELGSQTVKITGMAAYAITPKVQASFPGCTVAVYQGGTTTPATLYSDDNGTTRSNPFTGDATGYWFFYADEGTYDVVISGAGLPSPFTYGDLRPNDTFVTQPFNGAVRRTKTSKLNDTVTPQDFGAKGDGSTNDTTTMQAALNSGAAVIDGGGKTYAVSNVQVPSNITIQNMNISVIPGSAFPITGFTVNGTVTAKSNISFRNVNMNGNRLQMQGFDVNTGNDGDKSCFAFKGKASNVLLDHVTANYCGTDGLQLVSWSPKPLTDNDPDLTFHNVTVRDSTFKYNRRQGISFDSGVNINFIGITGEYNGLDMSEIQTLYAAGTSGNLKDWQPGTYTAVVDCATFAKSILHGDCGGQTLDGRKYADGIDVEGYGVGSGIHGLTIMRSALIQNARDGLHLLDTTDPSSTGFQPRRNVQIIGNNLDKGLHPEMGPFPAALYLTGFGNGGEWQDVTITGNTLYGVAGLFTTNNLVFVGNKVREDTASFAVHTGSVVNLLVEGNDLGGKIVNHYDRLGTDAPSVFPGSVVAGADQSVFTNYHIQMGDSATPLGIGSFRGYQNVIASFGVPLMISPNPSQSTLFGPMTKFGAKALFGSVNLSDQGGTVQVAGYINITPNASGSLTMGQYGVANPHAIINAQNTDGTNPSTLSIDFGGIAKQRILNSGALQFTGAVTFSALASLPYSGPGTMVWCTDCAIVTPPAACTGSGTGAWAFEVTSSVWRCPF